MPAPLACHVGPWICLGVEQPPNIMAEGLGPSLMLDRCLDSLVPHCCAVGVYRCPEHSRDGAWGCVACPDGASHGAGWVIRVSNKALV